MHGEKEQVIDEACDQGRRAEGGRSKRASEGHEGRKGTKIDKRSEEERKKGK